MQKVILIADDEPADAQAIQRVLGKANVLNPAHWVCDGAEAIAYLAGAGQYADRAKYPHPALLFLDLVMPGKSGLEVLDWLRNSPAPEHKVMGKIVLTGIGNHEQIRQAYLLGAHSFLIKPLRVEEFLNLVNGLRGISLAPHGQGRLLDFAKGVSW